MLALQKKGRRIWSRMKICDEIVPAIASVKLSELIKVINVSHAFLGNIRLVILPNV